MTSPSKAATPQPLHRQPATVTPLPSALSTRVENVRVRGRYPAGVVSLVRVRRHLRALESWALLDHSKQPAPAPVPALSPVEKAEGEFVYWWGLKDLATRMLPVCRRELVAACHGAGQALNPRFQAVEVLHLVPKASNKTRPAGVPALPESAATGMPGFRPQQQQGLQA